MSGSDLYSGLLDLCRPHEWEKEVKALVHDGKLRLHSRRKKLPPVSDYDEHRSGQALEGEVRTDSDVVDGEKKILEGR